MVVQPPSSTKRSVGGIVRPPTDMTAPKQPTQPSATTTPEQPDTIFGRYQNYLQGETGQFDNLGYLKYGAKNLAETALGFVKSTAKTAIQMPKTMISSAAMLPSDIKSYVLGRPVEETAARRFGEVVAEPSDVPLLGEVKGLSAVPSDVEKYGTQAAGETAGQAALQYLEAGIPGAGKLIGGLYQKGKTAVGPFSKWAKRFSTIPEETIAKLETPETAKEIEALRAGKRAAPELPEVPEVPKLQKPGTPEELRDAGKQAYETAGKLKEEVQQQYSQTRKAIIQENEGRIMQRSKDFVTGSKNALAKEGISVTKEGAVDITGSQFEGSEGAKTTLQRVYQILTRPVVKQSGKSVADDLLTRREALSNVMREIPEEQGNLRRVVGNMRDAFDSTLDDTLEASGGGEKFKAIRTKYAEMKTATEPVFDAMTKLENGRYVFSEDKAYGFINTALKENKFDNTELLKRLDQAAGSMHAEDLAKLEQARTAYQQAIEQAKAAMATAKDARAAAAAEEKAKVDALKQLNRSLSQMKPETTESLLSVFRGYGAKIPVVGQMFQPATWANVAYSRGLKAAQPMTKAVVDETARKAQLWLLANIIAAPWKGADDENE